MANGVDGSDLTRRRGNASGPRHASYEFKLSCYPFLAKYRTTAYDDAVDLPFGQEADRLVKLSFRPLEILRPDSLNRQIRHGQCHAFGDHPKKIGEIRLRHDRRVDMTYSTTPAIHMRSPFLYL
jgi:hypothetical protein